MGDVNAGGLDGANPVKIKCKSLEKEAALDVEIQIGMGSVPCVGAVVV